MQRLPAFQSGRAPKVERPCNRRRFHDALTGLPRGFLLQDRLCHALLRAGREQRRVAVMALALDGWEGLTDQEVADRLRLAVAERLSSSLRGGDTVARTGRDRFTLVLENLDTPEHAAGVAGNLLAVLALPQEIAGHAVQVAAAIGIALYPDDAETPAALMSQAGAALESACQEAWGTFRFFQEAMMRRAAWRLELEAGLRRALEKDELEVRYQPVIDLESGRAWGVEARVGWCGPDGKGMAPEDFLSLAASAGLLGAIGEWGLLAACRQLAAWQRQGTAPTLAFTLILAFNIPLRQWQEADFAARLLALARQHGIDPGRLRLEVAEQTLLAATEAEEAALRRWRETGFGVALVDFASAAIDLTRLSRLPIDVLKLSPCWLAGALDERAARRLRGLVALAAALGCELLAPGVETPEQARFLRTCGCPLAQGILFAPPQAADVLEVWLATRAFTQDEGIAGAAPGVYDR